MRPLTSHRETSSSAAATGTQLRIHPPNGVIVCVCGCGAMGLGVAAEFLRRGCTVQVYEALDHVRSGARARLLAILQNHVEAGLMLGEEVAPLAAAAPATAITPRQRSAPASVRDRCFMRHLKDIVIPGSVQSSRLLLKRKSRRSS